MQSVRETNAHAVTQEYFDVLHVHSEIPCEFINTSDIGGEALAAT
jgi:hypothetical protein